MRLRSEKLSLREKIGQCFCVGIPGPDISPEYQKFLNSYKIGNVILFARNIDNNQQAARLCAKLQEEIYGNTGQKAFIMIDQEGGEIIRLKEDAANIPGAMALAATGDPENAYLAGRITGRQLKRLGINFDLAPVLDVNCNPANPVIGVRSYGADPKQAAVYGNAMMCGLLKEGVLACGKHFPGHGDTALDSHLALPRVDKPVEELQKTELYPFREAVKAGIPAVMSAHILFPTLEPEEVPATMSRRILTGLLREEMGFEGLILSDCMEMGAIKEYYGTTEGILRAFEAGVDLVLVSHTREAAEEAIRRLEEAVQKGEIAEEVFDRAAERILSYKEMYLKESYLDDGRNAADESGWQTDRETAYRLLKKTITAVNVPPAHIPDGLTEKGLVENGHSPKGLPDIGANPVFIGCRAGRFSLVGNEDAQSLCFPERMAQLLGGTGLIISQDPDEAELEKIRELANTHTGMVIGTYNGYMHQGQKDLIRQCADFSVPVIVVALRNPYDLSELPENVIGIAAWEYSPRSLDVVAEFLKERKMPEGKMPELT
ncbi:MAG: beta-N-acetylhexosaminidase [Lachnospiraceae bacterium]|nr:beta-N-acetylhexosaminidase [Lachnospiraceae bacterium]